MNSEKQKQLESEELDRHLVTVHERKWEHQGKVTDYSTVAKITPKKLSLSQNSDWKEKALTFEKTRRQGVDCVDVEVWWTEKKTVRCSLGHDHVTESKDRHFLSVTMDHDHVESLTEWLNSGTWREIQGRKSPHFRVMRQALELIEAMEKHGDFSFMKGAIRKSKTELKNELGDK